MRRPVMRYLQHSVGQMVGTGLYLVKRAKCLIRIVTDRGSVASQGLVPNGRRHRDPEGDSRVRGGDAAAVCAGRQGRAGAWVGRVLRDDRLPAQVGGAPAGAAPAVWPGGRRGAAAGLGAERSALLQTPGAVP